MKLLLRLSRIKKNCLKVVSSCDRCDCSQHCYHCDIIVAIAIIVIVIINDNNYYHCDIIIVERSSSILP